MLTTSPLGRQRLPPLSSDSALPMAPPARLPVLAPSSPNLSPANSSVGTVKEGLASLEPGSDASASGVSTTLPHASPATTSPGDSAATSCEDVRLSEVPQVKTRPVTSPTAASTQEAANAVVTRTSLLRNSRDKKTKGKLQPAELEETSDAPEMASTRTSSPTGLKPFSGSASLEEQVKEKDPDRQDQIKLSKTSEGGGDSYAPSVCEDYATPSEEEEEFGEVPEDALCSSPSSASSIVLERPGRNGETKLHEYDYLEEASA